MLVLQLRRDGVALTEHIATVDNEIVGHVLFSRMPFDGPRGRIAAAALAPLAVVPERQRRGIGSALVRHGLESCRKAGAAVVVLLGNPTYYSRFGFSSALATKLRAPFAGPAFMALELSRGVLAEGGAVTYPAAFEAIM